MAIAEYVRRRWDELIQEFVQQPSFRALDDGTADRTQYDRFIGNVIRTHQNSPQFFGFLFALCPPESRDRIAHNLLEELGVEEASGRFARLRIVDLPDEVVDVHGWHIDDYDGCESVHQSHWVG